MGTSTNATLFFGYCWDEECAINDALRDRFRPDGDEDEDIEWSAELAREAGRINPWDSFVELNSDESYSKRQAHADRWCEEHREAIDTWYKSVLDTAHGFGVTLDTHCSGDCPMPCLHVWETTASRGYPVEVASLPAIDPTWVKKLDRWLDTMRIDRPQPTPRFWLVSYTG